ncbi:substrate-binding periplasmic protein [Aeromonas finlandensis]|uniref:substrate-binding periplasmic protein n=1 Tax=Aeromonas finlandensis TaxID=1543375 RepID=UPI00051B2BF3|nr:transporter substrate-binding domain-containing protein [Aeromonas finlandensis]
MIASWMRWLCLALMLATNTLGAAPLVIGAEDDWYPYTYKGSDNGQPQGLTPELVKAVFAEEGIAIVFRTLPFARCMQDTKQGQMTACFNAAITEDNRDSYYWHNTPLFEEDFAIFALANEPRRNLTFSSLEGMRVGIVIGYDYSSELMQNPKIRRIKAKSETQLIEMMVRGRIDYVLMSDISGQLKIKQLALEGKVIKVGYISTVGLRLAFSRTYPGGEEMARRFEEGLQKIKHKGTYEVLVRDFKSKLGLH